jgi:UDP-GlcNAc3NAcA epimerase
VKILTVLGARPQFIKAGSVSREIVRQSKLGVDIFEVIIHTGQHYDVNMSDVFFNEMQIPKPDYFLDIGGGSHGEMTGQMIEKIEKILLIENPDWLIIYGDTNSTLAGAISASKLHVKIAHIEAGLRSYNMKMPEEINRILTDRISNTLFCPTDTAVQNLKNEGYDALECKVVKSGDVMQDGAIFYKALAKKPSCGVEGEYILATVHRAENTDDLKRLCSIIKALNEINQKKQVILPLHPRTKKILEQNRIKPEFTVVDPIGYLEMVWLISNAVLIMTDSGGLQKEAFFFEKPCITLRDDTEWVELIQNRYNVLAGADVDTIMDRFNNYKFNDDFSMNLYGGGEASKRIIEELIDAG